jgi:hypothetical protein
MTPDHRWQGAMGIFSSQASQPLKVYSRNTAKSEQRSQQITLATSRLILEDSCEFDNKELADRPEHKFRGELTGLSARARLMPLVDQQL